MMSKFRSILAIVHAILMGILGMSSAVYAQTPVITARFANPDYNCTNSRYSVDVEFKSSLANQEIFGGNIRLFYDDGILEFHSFNNFQGGYAAVAPNPPLMFTSGPAGPSMFNFAGAAEYVNGAIQKTNPNAPPIILETNNWKKIFRISFLIDDPNADEDSFCPSLVWDLEQNPANGGFMAGSEGLVITVMDPGPGESMAATENVLQYNWQYIGSGSAPFGEPIEDICIPLGDIFVSNTNDSGSGSLRNAVACATDGDTLYFHQNLAGQTIQITSGRIAISKDIVLNSTLSQAPKISSSTQGLFDINATANVHFRNINIISGLQGSPGAAFNNSGYLVLYNVNILRNSALPSGHHLVRNLSGSHLELRGVCHLDWD